MLLKTVNNTVEDCVQQIVEILQQNVSIVQPIKRRAYFAPDQWEALFQINLVTMVQSSSFSQIHMPIYNLYYSNFPFDIKVSIIQPMCGQVSDCLANESGC